MIWRRAGVSGLQELSPEAHPLGWMGPPALRSSWWSHRIVGFNILPAPHSCWLYARTLENLFGCIHIDDVFKDKFLSVHRDVGGAVVKNPPANAGDLGDMGSIPGSGNGNPLQYFHLENPMDRGANMLGYSLWGHKRVRHDLMTKQQKTKDVG